MEMGYESQLMTKAKNFQVKKEYKNALKSYEDVITTNPNNSEAYFSVANIFHMQGQLGKAIKAFKKVLVLDPNHTESSISLSIIYNDIGKYDQAKEHFNHADNKVKNRPNYLKNDPHINRKFALKHFEIADLYLVYNRYDEALFEYNKCIKLDPENLEARIKISKVYAKKGFISKAVEELRRLKNEYPGYNEARIALGLVYYGNGKVLEAQTEWQRVLDKEPGNKRAHMYITLSQAATETSLSN